MRRSIRRTVLVLTAVAGIAAAGVIGFGAPASAHVTVVADEAVPGSMARVVFRMPNESDANLSTQLEVHFLPEGAPPVPSALPVPVPGWSVEVAYETLDEPVQGMHGEEITEVVSVITWTADDEGTAIEPGQLGEFPVVIGPLPEAETLYFPALQTYAGVEEPVRWISRPDPDGTEPPDPAPVLRLAASAAEPDHQPDAAPAGDAGDGSAGRSAGMWFGVAGLVAGLAGLALAGAAFARTRR